MLLYHFLYLKSFKEQESFTKNKQETLQRVDQIQTNLINLHTKYHGYTVKKSEHPQNGYI